MSDEQEPLEVAEDGPVLRITLNRARGGNALSGAMTAGLLAAFEGAARSNELRVIALTARGKNFCTGVDLIEANSRPASGDRERPTARPRAGHMQRRTSRARNVTGCDVTA